MPLALPRKSCDRLQVSGSGQWRCSSGHLHLRAGAGGGKRDSPGGNLGRAERNTDERSGHERSQCRAEQGPGQRERPGRHVYRGQEGSFRK